MAVDSPDYHPSGSVPHQFNVDMWQKGEFHHKHMIKTSSLFFVTCQSEIDAWLMLTHPGLGWVKVDFLQ